MCKNSIIIDGVEYIRADSIPDGDYVVVRTEGAGAFFGRLVEHDRTTETVVLGNVRRLWYWKGAASLSQLAIDGVSAPKECKFPVAVPVITLAGVIEVIPATEKARESIAKVPVWEA